LPVLTFVPEAKAPEGGRLFFGVAEPNHAFTESFRLLRNNVSFALPDTKLVTIAVTSAAISEGKSTVSVNLAIALAMDGKKVLLVDSDLRRPTIHKWMDISNEVGYTSVVVGTATLEEAVQPTQWEGLSALPSGPLPPGATEFLNSKKSHDTVAKIAELYDVVVLDAPPCTGLSDMQVISKLASGVIVVACLESTPKPLLVNTMRLLRQASAPLIGIVINRTKGTGKGKYGYYGYYGYYGSYGYYGYYGYEQEGSESEPRKKRKGTSKKS
jgi:capsular exopolysaccharide synthesis family protein